MNISPITSNRHCYGSNYAVKNPIAFTSYGCFPTMYRDIYGVRRRTQINTSLRDDLNYQKLAQMIKKKIVHNFGLKNEKAKIYCLAAADGTEAYAIADSIIGEFGFKKAKELIFPIFVSDINENVMNEFGKAGKIWFNDKDIEKLPNIKEFLVEIARSNEQRDKALYKLKPEFRDCFVFETVDLQKKIEDLPKPVPGENYWFVIRNCLWEPFGQFESEKILKELTNKYPNYPGPEQAYVVLGNYDIDKFTYKMIGKFNPDAFGLRYVENNTFVSIAGIRNWLFNQI